MRRVDIFLEAVLQKKGIFVMLQNLRHNSSNLFVAKKKSLDEIKALEDYVLLFIFCKFSAHYPALASAILQEL